MYKLQANFDINGSSIPANTVIKDGVMWIPMDEANRDYQEYLKWVAEGNTPEPAEVTE
jgi:hypothetical protein